MKNLFVLVDLDTFEVEPGVFRDNPKVGEYIVNWKEIGSEAPPGTRKVYHIIGSNFMVNRIRQFIRFDGDPGSEFLGNTYGKMMEDFPQLSERVMQHSWFEQRMEDGVSVDVRVVGTISEWRAAGEPMIGEAFIKPHLWLGVQDKKGD
jgi:hypothetical protein